MKIYITNKGYGLLGMLITVLIICILMSLVMSQYKNTLKKQAPVNQLNAHQQINVHQLQKQLNDTMMKHQTEIDNYGTEFQEKH